MTDELQHYGVLRRSGRYPWGSGDEPYQNGKTFLDVADELKRSGMSEKEIADSLGISTVELRERRKLEKAELRAEQQAKASRMREDGHSVTAISKELGLSTTTVNSLLSGRESVKKTTVDNVVEVLKETSKRGPVDIGVGNENLLGVSRQTLKAAVRKLKDEGYGEYYDYVEQLGTGKNTTLNLLAPPGMRFPEVVAARKAGKLAYLDSFSEDGGMSFQKILPPISVDSKRILVRFDEDGGSLKDGTIEIRPGSDELSLGSARYAQLRVAVDGKYYMKGMGFYNDDIPDGYDMVYNTNKPKAKGKFAAFKEMNVDADGKVDMQNPFGAVVKRQRFYVDKSGNKKQSPLNILNEEGDWDDWSRTLSAQFLSKQPLALAKAQLDAAYQKRKSTFDEINSLTNPTIKKKLLEEYADSCDSAAVTLRAHAMPRQRTQVLLPIKSLKDNEVYAPNYRNGENLVLVRFPHGGRFEIPEVRVNNRNSEGKRIIRDAKDAIGINSKVAERLSGADFDGDFVLAIPNNNGAVRTSKPLKGLEGFDPKRVYKNPEGAKPMPKSKIPSEMGGITNLIADMSIKGASASELARAVRHSMVVIDAHKHNLNYQQSAKDNGIVALKKKYQSESAKGGASTLITRSTSTQYVNDRKRRLTSDGGPIDSQGRKVFVETGATYAKRQPDGSWVQKPKQFKSTKMYEVDDARKLSSGSAIEEVYAKYANDMKAMGNSARLKAANTPLLKQSTTAKKVYKPEVDSLNAKLNVALQNRPRERRAQVLANTIAQSKLAANPDLSKDQIKKIKQAALNEARASVGSSKKLYQVEITAKEWAAIQAGAISDNRLKSILDNADVDAIKKLALPKEKKTITTAQRSRIKSLLAQGYTQAEVADVMGVSTSTVNDNK